ncbi:glycosyltransferase [candidate division KSB1 bacterium]|nr:glycosyltransferase [candidate division KSB1 bacterium]
MLQKGKCGLLVQPGDVDGMKQAIVKLIEDPKLRLSIGKKGHDHMMKNYTIDRYYSRIREIFSAVKDEGDKYA